MKIQLNFNITYFLLALFILFHSCQDFEGIDNEKKQNLLNHNFSYRALEQDYNSYDIKIIEEFMEDIAYNEEETYSNRNAYNEFKKANEMCNGLKEGWRKCYYEEKPRKEREISFQYSEGKKIEAIKRFEEEKRRLKEQGLIKRERKIRKIMDELYLSSHRDDYKYSKKAQWNEISSKAPYYYYYDVSYDHKIRGSFFSEYNDNEEFLETASKVYKIRKRRRQLRREEAIRRLKPYPFPITIRSFHPHPAFADGVAQEGDDIWKMLIGEYIAKHTQGKKFSGDNRGFSLSDDVTVRASMTFEIDPITGETKITKLYSDPTRHPVLGEATAIPEAITMGNNRAGYSAINPLISIKKYLKKVGLENYESIFLPEIDIRSTFQITRNELDENYDILKIRGAIFGDDYPNTESFIRDKSGNKIFLGTDVREKGYDHIPIPIMGWATTKIMSINVEIKIDENENFVSVKKDGRWVELWRYNYDHLYKHPGRRR